MIYYNDGDGISFSTTSTACRLHPTLDLEFGDIDNDNDLDLVIVGHYSEYICLNDGTGHFAETRWLSSPRLDKNTQSVALGDADSDGDLDIAVGRETHFNQVYVNDGTGHFSSFSFDPIWERTWDVTWGDVDNDGDVDIDQQRTTGAESTTGVKTGTRVDNVDTKFFVWRLDGRGGSS